MEPSPLRIVFFGTPDFAAASLRVLAQGRHHVVGVVTAPDKPAGRGQRLNASAVKTEALKHGLPLAQPLKLRDSDFQNLLQKWNADLFAVVAFRMLPESVWSLPRLGTVNVHGSLLPDFRGAAPIQHAVAAGETHTGVTSFFITREIDTGSVLLQRGCPIGPKDTSGDVYARLMEAGAGLLEDTLSALAEGQMVGIPQNDLMSGAERPAPKLFRQDGRIDWRRPPAEVVNFIRGMHPFPGAWTTLNGGTFKVHEGALRSAPNDIGPLKPGQCHTSSGQWWVGTAGAPILIERAQLAGKPAMSASDILRGYRYPTADLGNQGH